VTGMSR